MEKPPRKDYYRLSELADAWGCRIEDIHHQFLHGRIRVGVHFRHEILYGVNADFQTIGAYFVSGVLTIPAVCAETWEFDPTTIEDAGGFVVEADYPPEITEATHFDEPSDVWPLMPWAPGHDWDHPETNHGLIKKLLVGVRGIDENGSEMYDWRQIDLKRVVVHAVERERFEREYFEPSSALPSTPTYPPLHQDAFNPSEKEADALDRLLRRTLLALRSDATPKPTAKQIWKELESQDDEKIVEKKTADHIHWWDPDDGRAGKRRLSFLYLADQFSQQIRNTCRAGRYNLMRNFVLEVGSTDPSRNRSWIMLEKP